MKVFPPAERKHFTFPTTPRLISYMIIISWIGLYRIATTGKNIHPLLCVFLWQQADKKTSFLGLSQIYLFKEEIKPDLATESSCGKLIGWQLGERLNLMKVKATQGLLQDGKHIHTSVVVSTYLGSYTSQSNKGSSSSQSLKIKLGKPPPKSAINSS